MKLAQEHTGPAGLFGQRRGFRLALFLFLGRLLGLALLGSFFGRFLLGGFLRLGLRRGFPLLGGWFRRRRLGRRRGGLFILFHDQYFLVNFHDFIGVPAELLFFQRRQLRLVVKMIFLEIHSILPWESLARRIGAGACLHGLACPVIHFGVRIV